VLHRHALWARPTVMLNDAWESREKRRITIWARAGLPICAARGFSASFGEMSRCIDWVNRECRSRAFGGDACDGYTVWLGVS
jgi:hypothetical protein